MTTHSSGTPINYELDKARALLRLEDIYHLHKTIDGLLELPKKINLIPLALTQQRQIFVKEVEGFVGGMREPCIVSAIILGITALEVYLADLYGRLKGKEYRGRKLENAQTIEAAFQPTIIFKDADQRDTLDKIFQYRHVIVHRAGKFDAVACTKLGISTSYQGKNIAEYLEFNKVNGYLDYIEEYVRWIETSVLPSPLV